MFGLTKREQRWKAERQAAELMVSLAETVARTTADILVAEAQSDEAELRNLRAAIEQNKQEIVRLRAVNDFDAKRLRRVAVQLGISVPESDEALLECAGSVLGEVSRVIDEKFSEKP